VTALGPMIGYDKASAIAHKANNEGLTLKEAALQSSDIDEERLCWRLKPRRSRSWLTHWLLRSVLRGAVRTTARGAMDEQTAQVLVPALRDAHQHLAIAAGELSRDETNPGGEVPTILEL
jgi:hypothetical protein